MNGGNASILEVPVIKFAVMKFAVSIVAIDQYLHSQAFWEIAEAIHYGLLTLGYDSILTAETTTPDRWHIILGSNLLPFFPTEIAPRSIFYNLEQIFPGSPWLKPELVELFRQYPLWDYSQNNLKALTQMGIDHALYLPIGYVPELTRIPSEEEEIDVLFFGTPNDRRQFILEQLQNRGVVVKVISEVYGAERDRWIARAKMVLNIHLYEARVFELVRASYLFANHKFVISEEGHDPEENLFSEGLVFAPYDQLVETCLQFLNKPESREKIAQRGFELMTQRPQSEYLMPAVQALELFEAFIDDGNG
ncbi:MAG: glycosyltransferase [Leptolyngbyaceae cyanobacterium bins.59]|nr:glycosyltransferase [Leptolyngbyaceae cyanobacterium bins.59]